MHSVTQRLIARHHSFEGSVAYLVTCFIDLVAGLLTVLLVRRSGVHISEQLRTPMAGNNDSVITEFEIFSRGYRVLTLCVL